MPSAPQGKGAMAEQQARRYLEHQGLQFIDANCFFKTGELDLIMQDGPTLVFVEVRFRRHQHYGSAAESITRQKQQKLIRSALLYCQKNKVNAPWRIDVVTVTPSPQQAIEIHWIPSAITG